MRRSDQQVDVGESAPLSGCEPKLDKRRPLEEDAGDIPLGEGTGGDHRHVLEVANAGDLQPRKGPIGHEREYCRARWQTTQRGVRVPQPLRSSGGRGVMGSPDSQRPRARTTKLLVEEVSGEA